MVAPWRTSAQHSAHVLPESQRQAIELVASIGTTVPIGTKHSADPFVNRGNGGEGGI